MSKLTLTRINSGYASNTALDANSELIENALDNTISRDGTSPNEMHADFDMNGYEILNLKAPSSSSSAARLGDVQNAASVNPDWLATNIHTAVSKTTPVDADELPIVDSAASFVLKKLTWANLKATLWTSWGALTASGTSKTTPVDGDGIAIQDSAAANATKKLTWANLKATLGATFAALAGSISQAFAVSNLQFPAAQVPSSDPNNLDDYEEGTWTPGFALQTPGTSSFTYSIQQGTYTKIGRQVNLSFRIYCTASSAGTGTGNLNITGAPFAAGSVPGYHAGTVGYIGGWTTAGPTIVMIQGGTTTIGLWYYTAAIPVAAAGLTQASLGGAIEIFGALTYFV